MASSLFFICDISSLLMIKNIKFHYFPKRKKIATLMRSISRSKWSVQLPHGKPILFFYYFVKLFPFMLDYVIFYSNNGLKN